MRGYDGTAAGMSGTKKKLDHLSEAALPGIYQALYTMATFTRIHYAKIAKRAPLQDRAVYGIIAATIILLLLLMRWSLNAI